MPDEIAELVAIVDAKCVVGEGPVWDDRIGVLWFTDIQSSQLLQFDWERGALERFDLPERLGSLGLTENPGKLVCAFASGFAFYTPSSRECRWLMKTEPRYRGIRMNDGRVDRMGRFWAGSMVEDRTLAGEASGSLYQFEPGEPPVVRWMLGDVSISNSICFSRSGDTLFFADTPTREIGAFHCAANDGDLGPRMAFVRTEGKGVPDGSEIDAAGRLWNAEWGSGKVVAYEPDGSVHTVIQLAVSQATCPAFGGPDLDHLFVTTAREGLGPARLAEEPHAGDLFIYRTPHRGLPAPRFGVTQGIPA